MPKIEDHALIGDTHTAALVTRDGTIDWLCWPRFDSESVFGSLLDEAIGGEWSLRPEGSVTRIRRSYIGPTLALETVFETSAGAVAVVDFMPLTRASDPRGPRDVEGKTAVMRVVRGVSGRVPMSMRCSPRFDYGATEPWIEPRGERVTATAGGDAIDVSGEVDLEIDGWSIAATFEIDEGREIAFVGAYRGSHESPRDDITPADWRELLEATEDYWNGWAGRCSYDGRWRDQVVRNLVTLKGLTYSPTGGIIAAPTTSLPEHLGGTRNWDYRFCWLRDATLTLEVLLESGYEDEATEWHDWLLRAARGNVRELQVMYDVTSERMLPERVLPWLSGYEGSHPVRIGNAATAQFQLDVYGEVMDFFQSARRAGIDRDEAWVLQRVLADVVAERWREPDNGIWEIRDPKHHHVHSKAMAWVALDRAVRAVEEGGRDGDVETWRRERDAIYDDVMENGFDERSGSFVIWYGSEDVDASLLRLPLVGFVRADDERMIGTIERIGDELLVDGLVHRYRTGGAIDGFEEPEGAFFLCTFWLVDCLVLLGRDDDAERIFRDALDKANDVGLLSEQWSGGRMVGNFPQAFSHMGLVSAARAIEEGEDAPGLRRWR